MRNKEIEKELNKIKDKEVKDIVAYIERLENELEKKEEENFKLIDERMSIIEELEETIRAQTMLIRLSKNDEKLKETGIRRNVIYKEVLDIFNKNNKKLF